MVGLLQYPPTVFLLIITFLSPAGELKASVLMFGSIQSPAFTQDIVFILANHASIMPGLIFLVLGNRIRCPVVESQATNILFRCTLLKSLPFLNTERVIFASHI